MRSLLEGRVDLVGGETEIAAGVRIIPAPGRRPGHVAVELRSKGKRLLHLAGAIPHPILLEHPDWKSAIDDDKDKARATRRRFLDPAEAERVLVFLSHLPFPVWHTSIEKEEIGAGSRSSTGPGSRYYLLMS